MVRQAAGEQTGLDASLRVRSLGMFSGIIEETGTVREVTHWGNTSKNCSPLDWRTRAFQNSLPMVPFRFTGVAFPRTLGLNEPETGVMPPTRLGAQGALQKPFGPQELLNAIQEILQA